MRLDTTHLRYLTSEDWRVLTAVELCSRNHHLVPTSLILSNSHLRSSSAIYHSISILAKAHLIARIKNAKYDGYRLTYGGLDYLSLHSHLQKNVLYSTGNQIGVGKESDVFVVSDSEGKQLVLKIHRLGRISFRSVKNNRNYSKKQQVASWMQMSRLAALKEFSFMRALYENGFSVPEPIAQNRHTIVMELVDAFPLRQINHVPDPAALYAEMMEMILRLARVGLIHGDFNEFNILIKEEMIKMAGEKRGEVAAKLTPVLIDFPQMVSIDHVNAEMYFDRDVSCIKRFFNRKFSFTSDEPGPFLSETKAQMRNLKGRRLDVEVEASGFSKKMAKELDKYIEDLAVDKYEGENPTHESALGDANSNCSFDSGEPDNEATQII
ncbi:MAG: hypothetical protein Q9214_004434 [Letrouitia sp. 1 TL-2023]